MISIKDFGVASGTLCTGSIQTAIDEYAKRGGRRVLLPSGTYIRRN